LEKVPSKQNRYRQDGKKWRFQMLKYETQSQNKKLNPNKKFDAFDLDNAVEGFPDRASSGINFQNEQATPYDVIITGFENIPPQKLQMQLTDYNDMLKSEEFTFEQQEALCEKIRAIENELERRNDPDKAKSRNKIRMAIDRAMNSIAKAGENNNPLSIHLYNHIRTHWPIEYTPEKPIPWEP
jgi:hypothetical protein